MSRLVRFDTLQPFQAVNVLLDPGAIGGPIVIPNCTQVVLRWTMADGKSGHNVMYGRSAGIPAPTVAQANSILTGLSTGAGWTAMAATLSTSTSLAGVTLRSVHAAFQPVVESTGAAVPGADTNIALPN